MTDIHWVVGAPQAGERLDRFLAAPDRLGSRSKASTALERGRVFLNGTEMTLREAGRPLASHDQVRVWLDRPGTAGSRPRIGHAPGIDVIFEDEHLIVVNKPAGLLSVPLERKAEQPSILERLVERLRSHGKRRPLVVHRIDQDTSGLVVFAMNAASHRRLTAQFASHEPERLYLAVVYGHPEPPAGSWHDRMVWDDRAMIQKATYARDPRGVDATAEYRTLERFTGASLIEVRLVTGRRNQIRLQAPLRGHPLVGEQRYTLGDEDQRTIRFGRHALHAFRLGIVHPADGSPLQVEAPIPGDMNELLERLRRRSRPKSRPVKSRRP